MTQSTINIYLRVLVLSLAEIRTTETLTFRFIITWQEAFSGPGPGRPRPC